MAKVRKNGERLDSSRFKELARLQKRWSLSDDVPSELEKLVETEPLTVARVGSETRLNSLGEARFLAFAVAKYPDLNWPASIAHGLVAFLTRDCASEDVSVVSRAITILCEKFPNLATDLLRVHILNARGRDLPRDLLFIAINVRDADLDLFLDCVKRASQVSSPTSLSGILATGVIDADTERDEETRAFLTHAMSALGDEDWLSRAECADVISLVGDVTKIAGLNLLDRVLFGEVLRWACATVAGCGGTPGLTAMLSLPIAYWGREVDDFAPWMETVYRETLQLFTEDAQINHEAQAILATLDVGEFRTLSPITSGPIRANALARTRRGERAQS